MDTHAIDRCIGMWASEGNSGSTINRKLAALSKMLTEAQRLGAIHAKPYIRRQKENDSRIRYYSKEEEEEIVAYFKHIGQHEIADLCVVAVDTGLRIGTMLQLRQKFIDWKDGWIRLPGNPHWIMKNAKPHDVPMTKRVKEILKDKGEGGGLCFDVKYNSVTHYWRGLKSALGMEDDRQFVFHVFRHTFCSRLVQKGVPIDRVQKLAGHETLQMTMRYAKLSPKELLSAIDTLEPDEHTCDTSMSQGSEAVS